MDVIGSITRSNNGKAIGLAAVVATGLAAAYMYFSSSSQDKDVLPALDEEEAYTILKKIYDKLRTSSEKLMQHLPSIQQQLQAQGMDVPAPTVIKSYIFPHFEMAFKEIQSEILAEHDVEEYELEDAVDTYVKKGDSKLTELSEKLRMLYSALGGDVSSGEDSAAATGVEDDGSEELPLEALFHVLGLLSNHMTEEMDTYCKAFMQMNGPPSNQSEFQEVQAGMVSVSDRAEALAVAESGITSVQLQKSLMKHADNPQLQQFVQQLQYNNMKVMAENGIRLQ